MIAEAEAIRKIVQHIKDTGWTMAASEAINTELLGMKDISKLEKVLTLYESATASLRLSDEIERYATIYHQHGMGVFDSLHLAFAEANGYDVLLTTDDDFLKAARKLPLRVRVENPAKWIEEVR
jgi:predicted nucleic acid-binding protein